MLSSWLGEFWAGFWLGIMVTWTPGLIVLAWLLLHAPRHDEERNRTP